MRIPKRSSQPIRHFATMQKRIDELARIQDAAYMEQNRLELQCNELSCKLLTPGVYPVEDGHVVISHTGEVEFYANA